MARRPVRAGTRTDAGATTWRDVCAEAMTAVLRRGARAWLTVAGVAVGVFALCAVLALSMTGAHQVSARFDALKATLVTVQLPPEAGDGALAPPGPARSVSSAVGRLARLNGVTSSGTVRATQGEPATVRRFDVPVATTDGVARSGRQSGPTVDAVVFAVDVPAVRTLQLRLVSGRLFDCGHQRRHEPVLLLNELAAHALGISGAPAGRTALTVGGVSFLVLGVVADDHAPDHAPYSAYVPSWVAGADRPGLTFGGPLIALRTTAGAAAQVAGEAPIAAWPWNPDAVLAQTGASPERLQSDIEGDTRALMVVVGVACLLASALGISNTMLVTVMSRRHEIGIRRAIGATRRSILGQFLLECVVVGSGGGVLGVLAAMNAVGLLALGRGWVAVQPLWLPAAGVVLGLCVGVAAGLYPAMRAAAVEPAEALRQ